MRVLESSSLSGFTTDQLMEHITSKLQAPSLEKEIIVPTLWGDPVAVLSSHFWHVVSAQYISAVMIIIMSYEE